MNTAGMVPLDWAVGDVGHDVPGGLPVDLRSDPFCSEGRQVHTQDVSDPLVDVGTVEPGFDHSSAALEYQRCEQPQVAVPGLDPARSQVTMRALLVRPVWDQ